MRKFLSLIAVATGLLAGTALPALAQRQPQQQPAAAGHDENALAVLLLIRRTVFSPAGAQLVPPVARFPELGQ